MVRENVRHASVRKQEVTCREWYLKPGFRFDQARKWEGFLKEAMSYKKIDRGEHSQSRDIVLKGEAYDEF